MSKYFPLVLKANDGENMAVISGLVQDSLFPLIDVEYNKQNQIFVMVLNRFAWECATDSPYTRTHSILYFKNVTNVASQNVDMKSDRMCSILSTIPTAKNEYENYIYISLAGGGAIRLTVSSIDIILKDVGDVWETSSRPFHENDNLQS